ncbi:MAG: hypothetical protein DMG05_05650 [Acidobacteria bacterium]|nr:MAG: hypothetical protein DMG05_05650 [Acidobacteriota bacterium]
MKKKGLITLVLALYFLHQDFWFWRTPHPLLLGFIPIGLSYHVCYSIAVALAMGLFVKYAWPSHLEEKVGRKESWEE